jgi:hypothetical protein
MQLTQPFILQYVQHPDLLQYGRLPLESVLSLFGCTLQLIGHRNF